MKKLLPFVLLVLLISCSKEEQTPPPPTKYTVSITLNPTDGGTVSPSGGQFEEGTTVSFTVTPSENYIFKNWSGSDTSSNNPLSLTINSNKTLTVNFEKKDTDGDGVTDDIDQCPDTPSGEEVDEYGCVLVIESIEIINPLDKLVISRSHQYSVLGRYNGGSIDLSELISLETSNNYSRISDQNELIGVSSGQSTVKISYNEFEVLNDVEILHYEEVEPHDFLKTPVENSSLIVPVVILTYIPVSHGIYVDQSTYPIRDYGDKIYDDLSIREVQNWVLSNDIRTKFSIEEGSKFRGYKNPYSDPYVGIKVVKQFNYYEIPKTPNLNQTNPSDGDEGWYPNYQEVFDEIDLQYLVEVMGVKEVWFNSKSLSIPESNMSSPSTGDISNSYRVQDDLPIYNNTYVVYGNFIHRWYGENIHNRGHQIESQLSYIEKDKVQKNELFWNLFVGRNSNLLESESRVKNGRSGDTHFPPNGRYDYDYDNIELVLSDIGDWKPDNSGEKVEVNVDTWKFNRELPVSLPEFEMMEKYRDLTQIDGVGGDPQGGWLIYWFQSIPGKNNNIPYTKNGEEFTLTNWWELFYNWDESINNDKTLWE
jgi:hypothetical protein